MGDANLTGRAMDLVDKPDVNFIIKLIVKHQCRPDSNHLASAALDGHFEYQSGSWDIQKLT